MVHSFPVLLILRDEYGGAFEATGTQVVKRAIGVAQRIVCRLCDDADFWREAKKVDPVFSGKVCNLYHLSFLPKQRLGKTRYITHVNARADYASTFAHGFERRRNEAAHGRENDGGVERFGRQIFGRPGPYRSKPASEMLCCRIAYTGRSID